MTLYDDLELVRAELTRCMKCGNCMAVCPVYGAGKAESHVARGKIAVAEAVLDGRLAVDDPKVVEMLFNCLVCKSCMQTCPTQVQFDRIMLALRAAIVRKQGLHRLKELIFGMLRHQQLFDKGMRLGAVMQGLVFRSHPDQRAISPRSPFAAVGKGLGFDGQRLMPALAATPLRNRFPEVVSPPEVARRVAFFTGCSLNYLYPDVGEDIVEILLANKVQVMIPKEQNCCGIAVFVHGDVETARMLARRNIDAMEQSGADHIVTGCGSCGGAWQHDFQELLSGDPEYAPKAAAWAGKTLDLSTFLTRVVKYRRPLGVVETTVTYHDSCHLRKSMKVWNEPRQILNSIPGVTLREMAGADKCCGSGGSYVLTHYATSAEIANTKVANIAATGATTVTTGCPACMMQLLDQVGRFGQGQAVRHWASLLAASYRQEKNGPLQGPQDAGATATG
ncbi:MAG: iron-sulfur cluster-binding protein [Desulfobulbaceae bacterium A2]|nr:MAG: iron-sulfur cluster-binding protein [Desulfobulbaceae bacterium A2]